jgi:hypothetical protein
MRCGFTGNACSHAQSPILPQELGEEKALHPGGLAHITHGLFSFSRPFWTNYGEFRITTE